MLYLYTSHLSLSIQFREHLLKESLPWAPRIPFLHLLHLLCFSLLLSWLSFFKKIFYFIFFLERGREGGSEGEKHQCVVASCVPPTEDLACNPGMCPDWKLNWQPLVCRPVLNPLSHTTQGMLSWQSLITRLHHVMFFLIRLWVSWEWSAWLIFFYIPIFNTAPGFGMKLG